MPIYNDWCTINKKQEPKIRVRIYSTLTYLIIDNKKVASTLCSQSVRVWSKISGSR